MFPRRPPGSDPSTPRVWDEKDLKQPRSLRNLNIVLCGWSVEYRDVLWPGCKNGEKDQDHLKEFEQKISFLSCHSTKGFEEMNIQIRFAFRKTSLVFGRDTRSLFYIISPSGRNICHIVSLPVITWSLECFIQ